MLGSVLNSRVRQIALAWNAAGSYGTLEHRQPSSALGKGELSRHKKSMSLFL